ncbi:STAS domain-containing protein [Candidatus Binatia bacterium]|nr:STAS domain-containing protein [Candidatus Binatia bacterium]
MDITESRQNGFLILTVTGRVDASNASSLEKTLLTAIDGGERRIVVDCAPLEYISSAGLRALLLAAKRVAPGGGALALAALRDEIKEVFDMAGFSAIFRVFPTTGDALAAGR